MTALQIFAYLFLPTCGIICALGMWWIERADQKDLDTHTYYEDQWEDEVYWQQ